MFERNVETALKTHEPFTFYYHIIRPDGEERVIHARGVVKTDEHGNPTRVYGAAQDVTEIKRAEDEIRKQKELLQTIFDNVPTTLSVVDENGHLSLVNPEWERTFGWTVKELDERNLDIVAEMGPDLAERQRIQKLLAAGTGEWNDFKIRTRDGRILDVWGAVVRIFDGTSIGIAQDITERKQAEVELLKHREHLEELVKERTAELAVAKDKAEEAGQLKSTFLATMSHELRTPLNSIIGFTGIMLQGLAGPLNDEQQKQLTMVKNSARHLLNLINDVLDLSKIEAGQVELRLESLDMRALIDKTVQTLAPLAEKKQLQLIADVAPEVDQVISDRRRVEQILINLVNNAIKFTEQGQVRIECRADDGRLLTSVVDTGIGIKPEDLPKLFTSFQQLDGTLARKHEGTGLGLAICKKLVGLLGGEIWAESAWEGGSIFTFVLPLNREEKEHAAADSDHRG
jgi:PAS domain S-box-containing protein